MLAGAGREDAGRFAASVPFCQAAMVLSQKYFIGAAMLPKRTGLPRARPSIRRDRPVRRRSTEIGNGWFDGLANRGNAGTVRSRAWHAGDRLDAAGNAFGQGANRTAVAVVEDEDILHGRLLYGPMQKRPDPVRLLVHSAGSVLCAGFSAKT